MYSASAAPLTYGSSAGTYAAYGQSSAYGTTGVVDLNNDGFISQQEMLYAQQAAPTAYAPAPAAQMTYGAPAQVNYGASAAGDLFDRIDNNHDGTISRAEFAHYM